MPAPTDRQFVDIAHYETVPQVGQDVEVRTTKVACGIREVGIQRLKRLVQVADLVIPQVVCACADVSDLCHPVLRKLVLNPQIPLDNPWHAANGTGRAHDSSGVIGISEGNNWRKASRYELTRGGDLAHVEEMRRKRQLWRVQTQVIEDVPLA